MIKTTKITFEEAYQRLLGYAGRYRILRRGFSKKKVEAEIEKGLLEEVGETEAEKRFWLLYKILIKNVSGSPKFKQDLLYMSGYVTCLVEALPGNQVGRQIIIDVFGVPYQPSKKLLQALKKQNTA